MPTKVKGTTGVDKVEAGAVITNPEFSGNATVTGTLTVNSTASINGSNLPQQFGFRNLVINGDMQIAQRGTSTTGITGTDYGGPDRFQITLTTAGTWTLSQDTDVPSGQGFANSLKLECTTADASLAAGDRIRLRQSVEAQNLQHLAFGTASAKSLTLSFWVKSNKTGTYIAELYSSDSNRNISKTYSIDSADTWEKKTFTYTGDTVGTIVNDNGIGIQVYLWLGAGTDYTSGTIASDWESTTSANRAAGLTVNLADSTSNYINITGVQLEVGEGASDFEFLPYDVQLARCQRYFFRDGYGLNGASAGVTGPMGIWYNATDLYAPYYFPVEMRSAPTVSSPTVTGGYRWHKANSSSDVDNFGTSFTSINRKSMYVRNTQISGGTAGDAAWGIFRLAGAYVELDAEL